MGMAKGDENPSPQSFYHVIMFLSVQQLIFLYRGRILSNQVLNIFSDNQILCLKP